MQQLLSNFTPDELSALRVQVAHIGMTTAPAGINDATTAAEALPFVLGMAVSMNATIDMFRGLVGLEDSAKPADDFKQAYKAMVALLRGMDDVEMGLALAHEANGTTPPSIRELRALAS